MRDKIGEGGGEAKKRKKSRQSYRRDVEHGGDWGGRGGKEGQDRAGPIDDVDPDDLDNVIARTYR